MRPSRPEAPRERTVLWRPLRTEDLDFEHFALRFAEGGGLCDLFDEWNSAPYASARERRAIEGAFERISLALGRRVEPVFVDEKEPAHAIQDKEAPWWQGALRAWSEGRRS